MMHTYQDIAIPIAWPDQTARGDELWFKILKGLGIVKNLNFRIGHAAILLIERQSGQIKYFDFGRYICPRGYGRARSAAFDPRLKVETVAQFSNTKQLVNLAEILAELSMMEEATHGGGRLLCSVSQDISFQKAAAYAEALVNKGPVLYGALAANNNSCSRYVAQILVEGMMKDDKRISKILYPESLKASPTSNVVNANTEGTLYCYANQQVEQWKMSRKESLKFQIKQLSDNFSNKRSKDLPGDTKLGLLDEPMRPMHIPSHATWLGGMGEGCWYALSAEADQYEITKYNYKGAVDYIVAVDPIGKFDHSANFEFTYDIHYRQHVIKQINQNISFLTKEMHNKQIKQSI